MNAATVLTNNVYLNAQDNPDAVFVIKINGALSTSTYAKVILINGAQAKNVYWKVDGAVSISDYSEIKGTIVGNNGAVDLMTGVNLQGRAFSTTGTLTTAGIVAQMPVGCATMATASFEANQNAATFYPNPFSSTLNIMINDIAQLNNTEVRIYDVTGREMTKRSITGEITTLETNLSSGIYFYKVLSNSKVIQSGKLISKQ